MSKQRESIDPEHAAWIGRQRIFFVATAPLSPSGRINASPKGGEAFRVLGPLEGAETVARLRENGRIVVMFCAFDGRPIIIRLHGQGTVITPNHPKFAEIAVHFPHNPGKRAIIHVAVNRISDSCGWSVPLFDFREHRDALDRWAANQGPEKLDAYRQTKNVKSIDGLPAFK